MVQKKSCSNITHWFLQSASRSLVITQSESIMTLYTDKLSSKLFCIQAVSLYLMFSMCLTVRVSNTVVGDFLIPFNTFLLTTESLLSFFNPAFKVVFFLWPPNHSLPPSIPFLLLNTSPSQPMESQSRVAGRQWSFCTTGIFVCVW